MGYTDKQIRNGATGDGGERSTQPGPMPDIAPLIPQAVNAAEGRGQDAAVMLSSPQGSGPSSSSYPTAPERVVGANGNIWEWDSGLAVSEMPGEA